MVTSRGSCYEIYRSILVRVLLMQPVSCWNYLPQLQLTIPDNSRATTVQGIYLHSAIVKHIQLISKL